MNLHIFGASGSGTTTLAGRLAAETTLAHVDTDDHFWRTKYTDIEPMPSRLANLADALDRHPSWVLSGSLCGWGDPLIPRFDLVVFLSLPNGVRLDRLRRREIERYGAVDETFLAWADRYETGGPEVRSRVMHETWLAGLTCPVLRLEGVLGLEEKLAAVKERL